MVKSFLFGPTSVYAKQQKLKLLAIIFKRSQCSSSFFFLSTSWCPWHHCEIHLFFFFLSLHVTNTEWLNEWRGGMRWIGGCAVGLEEHTWLVTLTLLFRRVMWREVSWRCKNEVTASNDQSASPVPTYVFVSDEWDHRGVLLTTKKWSLK